MSAGAPDFLLLQGGYFAYSLSALLLKSASALPPASGGFALRFAGALACLGAFAAVWQRVLRRRSLTSAYAWRGVVFLWAFLWAALFFGERVTANNVAGAGIILCGMLLAGGDE